MTLSDQLEALDAKATAGPWETDSTDNGGSGSERFNYYSVGAGPAGKWETIVDTLNSDVAEIHEEWDGDEHGVYHHAWDDQGRANCELIVALRNAVPEILAALRKAETPSPDVAGLVERLRTHNGLPSTFDMVGDNVEPLFDPGNRHKSGKKPFDFLKSWLSMLRPFAYATADESWGELEKLLCIVMRNYIRRSRLLTEAADTLTAQAHLIAKLEAVMERCAVIVDRNLYRQHEKVEDVPKLLRNAIKGGRDD